MRDIVYSEIRKSIVRGTYKPGEKLQEEKLAEELGVSRTPVREALRKLEVERFVTYYPHRGTVVSSISTDEISDLYKVRCLLERLIVCRAAKNATPTDIEELLSILKKEESAVKPDDILDAVDEFNNTIYNLSNAETLIDLAKKVREFLSRTTASNHLNPIRRQQAHEEHLHIIDALSRNDPDLAEKYTIEHLNRSPLE